jgi:hypothetical protein
VEAQGWAEQVLTDSSSSVRRYTFAAVVKMCSPEQNVNYVTSPGDVSIHTVATYVMQRLLKR